MYSFYLKYHVIYNNLPPADRLGWDIIKCPPSIRSHFYKMLLISFTWEEKITKLSCNIIRLQKRAKNFGLILKNKMAATDIFRLSFFIFSSSSYFGCVIARVLNFLGEINYYMVLLKKSIFGVCLFVCVYTGLVG